MPNIEIDQDLLETIKLRALPWVDSTPSDTIRRLLGLAEAFPQGKLLSSETTPTAKTLVVSSTSPGGRQKKVDLWSLKNAGLLAEGQTLYLRDYSGKPVPDAQATVGSLNKVISGGRKYSMSLLAGRLLKRAGYAGTSVRGPAHWFTSEGVSVLDLWKKYVRELPK